MDFLPYVIPCSQAAISIWILVFQIKCDLYSPCRPIPVKNPTAFQNRNKNNNKNTHNRFRILWNCTVQLVEYFPEENNLAVVYFTKILKLIQRNISYEENTLADYFTRETTLGERFLWGKNFNKPCVKEINSSGIFPGTTTTTLYRTISDGDFF